MNFLSAPTPIQPAVFCPLLPAIKGKQQFKKSLEDIRSSVKKIDFKQCPSLENVILNVNCDLGEFFKQEHQNLPTVGFVEKLKFNPKDSLKTLGLEHIFFCK